MITEELKKQIEEQGWEALDKPVYLNIYPDDLIFADVCELINTQKEEDDIQYISLLIVAKSEE